MNDIFISYARENFEEVQSINSKLKLYGIKTWMDKSDMLPGKWKPQIENAIRNSRYFFLFISNIAIEKIRNGKGVQGEEFEYAYEFIKNLTEVDFAIIPIRLEECDRGDLAMRSFNQYDFYGKSFNSEFEKLTTIILQNSGLASKEQDTTRVLFDKSYLFFNQGQFKESIKIYKKVIELDNYETGISAEATKMIGLNFSRLKKHKAAIIYLNESIEKGSDYATSYYYLGEEYFHLKNYKKAIELFNKALNHHSPQRWVNISAKKMKNQISEFLLQNSTSQIDKYINCFYTKPNEIKVGDSVELYWDVKKGNTIKLFSVYYKSPGFHKDIEYVDEWNVERKGTKIVFPKIYNAADSNNWSYFLLEIDNGKYYKTISVKIKH